MKKTLLFITLCGAIMACTNGTQPVTDITTVDSVSIDTVNTDTTLVDSFWVDTISID